jgi:two-component system chemotaxis response regulator CheB
MVVDDSAGTLAAICEYRKELPAFELAATAQDGLETVEKSVLLEPELVLMDFQMLGMNRLQPMTRIKSSKSYTKATPHFTDLREKGRDS